MTKINHFDIAIIGVGYVGLVTGACLADLGYNVTCIDIDKNKIARLQKGIISIYELGLQDIVKNNLEKKRLHFSHEFSQAIQKKNIIFIAVDTPAQSNGATNLNNMFIAAEKIGTYIQHDALIIIKSTVPPGTTHQIYTHIHNILNKRASAISCEIAANPEFLKEGNAVYDFLYPHRIVLGTDTAKAYNILAQLYQPFQYHSTPILHMDVLSAELTKYATNAMLATKVSFMNEMAHLCEKLGADIQHIRLGMGKDPRIGLSFMHAGIGYGGSCLPKDIHSLIHTAQNQDYQPKILQAVQHVNTAQKKILYQKIKQHFHPESLSNKKIAIWGLAFKPYTDDIRNAPSITLIQALCKEQCSIAVYDPAAMKNIQQIFDDQITYGKNCYDILHHADALVITTEWPEFQAIPLNTLHKYMKTPLIFDGRNIFNRAIAKKAGFIYYGIGHCPTSG